jgi:hypothetical protein
MTDTIDNPERSLTSASGAEESRVLSANTTSTSAGTASGRLPTRMGFEKYSLKVI